MSNYLSIISLLLIAFLDSNNTKIASNFYGLIINDSLQESRIGRNYFDTVGLGTLEKKLNNLDTIFINGYLKFLRNFKITHESYADFEEDRMLALIEVTRVYPSSFMYEQWNNTDTSIISKFYKEKVIDVLFNYYCSSCLFGNTNLDIRQSNSNLGRGNYDKMDVTLKWTSKSLARDIPLANICKHDSVLKYIRYPTFVNWKIITQVESSQEFSNYEAVNGPTLKNRVYAKDTQFVRGYLSYLREYKRGPFNQIEFQFEKIGALSFATGVYPKIYSNSEWEDRWEKNKLYIEWYYKEVVFDQLFQYYCNSCLFGNTNLEVHVNNTRHGALDDLCITEKIWNKNRDFPSSISLQDICKSDTILKYIRY